MLVGAPRFELGTPSRADRNIAIVASGTGVYRPSAHRKMLEAAPAGVRVGDYEAFVDTHVRRLEALRRAGMSSGQRRLLAHSQKTSRFVPLPTTLARSI